VPTIRIDEDVYKALQQRGEPFVDTPNSVLRKLLEEVGLLEIDQESSRVKPSLIGKTTLGKKGEKPMVTYSHPRLCFKASYIEPLDDNDIFQIETKIDGKFQMSKADFYRVFSNVVKSRSYREEGIYHYPVIPKKKALPFKIA